MNPVHLSDQVKLSPVTMPNLLDICLRQTVIFSFVRAISGDIFMRVQAGLKTGSHQWQFKTDQSNQKSRFDRPMCDYDTELRKVKIEQKMLFNWTTFLFFSFPELYLN